MSEQAIEIKKTLLGKVDDKTVYLVDGDAIKVRLEMDFL